MGKVNLTNFASYGRLHLTSLDINHLAGWKMADSDGGGGVGVGVGGFFSRMVVVSFGRCGNPLNYRHNFRLKQ